MELNNIILLSKSKAPTMYLLRAPASQNGLKGNNTRLKHQSEQFSVAKKPTIFGRRPPLYVCLLPKFFKLLLKVSYVFLSIHFGLQGLSKHTFWDLGLLQNQIYLVSFVT